MQKNLPITTLHMVVIFVTLRICPWPQIYFGESKCNILILTKRKNSFMIQRDKSDYIVKTVYIYKASCLMSGQ